ncbi:Na(+)/H(+) antiporter subunit D [Halobacteriales archaeon Cl-PHB]
MTAVPTSLLTALPPAFVVLLAALLAVVLPRRLGHAVGVLATALVVPWAFLLPEGSLLAGQFLGFDAAFLYVDGFSRLMGIIFGLIGAVAVLYSAYTDASNVQTAYALSYVGTSLGAVFAGDWLTLLFFWELMALTSTLLVWDYGGKAVRAGFRYALLHGLGGSLLMAGILWHYAEVGSFLFTASQGISPGVPQLLAALGIGVNVGFVGLHAWLPDTYPRPQVAASVFLCVYTTKTGVYGMYRAIPDGNLTIAYMGGAMAVFGVTYALFQNDMRRLLSYHIQSQVGYMIAGVGMGSALATAGGFAHVFNHILYKSLLFMTVGVVIWRTGEENLKYLGGLGRKMPITAIAFAIAALSIAGFPGFNGFVSKGMVTAAAHKNHLDALFWLLIIGGVGTFMSFIKLGYYVFLGSGYDGEVADANRGQQVALLSVAGLCVLFGLYPQALFDILPLQGQYTPHPFTTSHLIEGFLIAAAGLVAFAAIKRPLEKAPTLPDVDAIYNPTTFYGARGLVRGVTETYAAVDRAAVGLTRAAIVTARRPQDRAGQVAAGLGLRDDDAPLSLQAGLGTSVFLVFAVVSLVLLVALLVA